MVPDSGGIFQDDNASIPTAHVVKNWFEKHESELEHRVATMISRFKYNLAFVVRFTAIS